MTPVLELEEGKRYFFHLGDSSMRSHPFYLTIDPDSRRFFDDDIVYTSSTWLILEVTESIPDVLYYSCSRHRGMGGDGYLEIVSF